MPVTGWFRRWRRERALERRPIPDDLWRLTLARFPFLATRSATELDRLRELATLFLAEKEFTGAHGLQVTDAMAVAIAAQACLPVLALGLDPYGSFVGIVVQPDAVVARRSHEDDDGVVHDWDEELVGEAMAGGPVMLSWREVQNAGETAEDGFNVVVHEFAHVVDLTIGLTAGIDTATEMTPRGTWLLALDAEYQRFAQRVDAHPDGDDGSLLDPYGATELTEYFAVASETFFVLPAALRQEEPALYALLAEFWRQDPAATAPN
jgi:Mlc titration factor MtfA (ptsG expression regulator)